MAETSKKMYWAGWVVSILPAALFIITGSFGLIGTEQARKGFAELGYPANTMIPIALAEVISAILYLIPRTRVLGAILMVGYLGGATATHVHAAQPYFFPVIVGILVWLGLYLRDARVRELVPLTK